MNPVTPFGVAYPNVGPYGTDPLPTDATGGRMSIGPGPFGPRPGVRMPGGLPTSPGI